MPERSSQSKQTSSYLPAIQQALADARRDFQRRLVVLSGRREWSLQLVVDLLRIESFAEAVWVGDSHPQLNAISAGKAHTLLGRNLQLAVYDAWAGLHPDGLAAVAGAVSGGGLLILCVPAWQDWPAYADPDYQRLQVYPETLAALERRFQKRLIAVTERAPAVCLLKEGIPAVLPPPVTAAASNSAQVKTTADQQRAIDAIVHVLDGHSRRPLVMTADRGRGKSSALGLASARLMQRGDCRLLITAPQRSAVAPVFEHAARVLGLAEPVSQTQQLELGTASLCFKAPDEVLQHLPDADLVMVDEAAAIPATILERMARHYNRLVFSTTVHGYEGTGRGFDLRFKKTLQQIANQVPEVQLQQPIRWADNDPLERWLYDALLLNASAAAELTVTPGTTAPVPEQCVFEQLDRDQLVLQPQRLQQLFGLLILAHYQTTPSDLRNLLDGPNVSIWIASCQGQIVAAALIAVEGDFEQSLDEQVWRGERRPRGHLLPQTLSAHAGIKGATRLRYWRVMRVAVHSACQRSGIGRALLQSIIHAARQQQVDIFGSSFAATADVVSFWRALQCTPVRLGVSRDASSGCHSAIVLSALSQNGDELLQLAHARFAEQFPRQLESLFKRLESHLVAVLLADLSVFSGYYLQQQDWLDCEAFACGGRQFSDARLALTKLVLGYYQRGQSLAALPESLLIRSILQLQNIEEICSAEGLTGKKQWLQLLRQAVKVLFQHMLDKHSAN